jgi:hypothetical protein
MSEFSEMVYVKQVSVSDLEESYPQTVTLSIHRDEMSKPLFEVFLEKYLDEIDFTSNEIGVLRGLLSDKAESIENGKTKRLLYQAKQGQTVVGVNRVSENQFQIQGKLCIDGNVIEIQPLDEMSHQSKHFFSLKRNGESDECPTDEKHQRNELGIIKKKLPNFKLSNAFGTYSREAKSKDRVKREIEHLTIDLLMVIDFAAYSWWKDMVGKPDSQDFEIMAKIRQYYAYIFKGIDDRFGSIQNQGFKIDLAFAGLFVAKTEIESYWTTKSVIDGDGESIRVMVNSSEALEKFQKWLDESNFLPKYDHAMLFTGTNLTYAGSPGNTGLAFASSMCRNISNSSIVEDIFEYRTVTFATQQIARALGTRDDMDNNDCLEFFNYMMVPKFKLPIKSFGSNKWKFSQCSEQYINDYIVELNDDGLTCLKESSLEVRYPPELAELITELPGVTYTGRQQCENAFGLGSDVCRKEIKTEYSQICGGLLCTFPGSEYCGFILPADGTPCGNKKYCHEGSCIENNSAPESSDTCAFGNEPNIGCFNLVVSEPSQCYIADIRHTCCQTCEALFTGITGCEYGDRSDDCMRIECENGDQDYAPKTCCLTCFDGPTPFARPQLSTMTEMSVSHTSTTATTAITTAGITSTASNPSTTSQSSILPLTYANNTPSTFSSLWTTAAPAKLSDNPSSSASYILSSTTSSTFIPTSDKHVPRVDTTTIEDKQSTLDVIKLPTSSASSASTYEEYQDIFDGHTTNIQPNFDSRITTSAFDDVEYLTTELPTSEKPSVDATNNVEQLSTSQLLQSIKTSIATTEASQNYASAGSQPTTESVPETTTVRPVQRDKCAITPICNCIVKVAPVSSTIPVSSATSSKQSDHSPKCNSANHKGKYSYKISI